MIGKTVTEGIIQGFKPIKRYLYKHFLPKKYQFHSVVPVTSTFQALPFHQWSVEKQRLQNYNYLKLFSIFMISFVTADIITSFKYNQQTSYLYYIKYPILAKACDDCLDFVKGYLPSHSKPTNKYEMHEYWYEVFDSLRQKKSKEIKHDERANMLKKEIEEMDRKYPLVKQQ